MSANDLRTFYQRYIDMLNAHELHRVDESAAMKSPTTAIRRLVPRLTPR